MARLLLRLLEQYRYEQKDNLQGRNRQGLLLTRLLKIRRVEEQAEGEILSPHEQGFSLFFPGPVAISVWLGLAQENDRASRTPGVAAH